MNPTPQQIKQARKDAGLTQEQASRLVYTTPRTWRRWENGEVQMSQAHWELFNIKVKK